MAETLGHRGSSEARASEDDVGTTITAVLDDGPLRGERIEAHVVAGPPAEHDRRARRRRQHVPLLPREVDPERPLRDVHLPLPRVDAPRHAAGRHV